MARSSNWEDPPGSNASKATTRRRLSMGGNAGSKPARACSTKTTMKRPAKDGDEQDCFSSFRNIHKWLKRARAASKIKKRHNRRERRKFNQIKKEL